MLTAARTLPRLAVRSYVTATAPRAVARKGPPSGTTAADLHELPQSVRGAAKPSGPSSGSVAPSGNSTSPEDISSRPAGPGPSAPVVDARVAAPDTVSRGANGAAAAGEQAANWTTSFAGMSERPFDGKAAEVLGEGLNPEDVEIKPGEWSYLTAALSMG